jgi:putative DNA primase/helicase
LKKDSNSLSNLVDDSDEEKPEHINDIVRKAQLVGQSYEMPPIYTENAFFMYGGSNAGIWELNTHKLISKKLIFGILGNDPDANKNLRPLIKAMETIFYKESFPSYNGTGNILVFKNCAFNPLTGQQFDFSPYHYSRNSIGYRFNANAHCNEWDKFIDQTFYGDPDSKQKIALLQEYMGLSLTNVVKFQQMLMMFGAGSNGKSVILKVVEGLVGEGNTSHVALKDFSSKFSLVKLTGKLVNIDADVEYDAMKHDGLFKKITSGDEIMVEEKHQGGFKFRPCAKLWMAANVLPRIKNGALGYYRRIIILEFNNVVKKEDQDKELVNKLLAELPGILNWALVGLNRLMENNAFTIPESSEAALKTYELENNHAKLFFNEKLVLVDQNVSKGTKRSVVFNEFTQFLSDNQFPKIDSAKFGKELKALGVTDRKSGSNRFYNVEIKKDSLLVDDSADTISKAANDEIALIETDKAA